jgi:hypothetical protein
MEIELFETDFRIGGARAPALRDGRRHALPRHVIENDGRFEDIVEGERIVVSTSMTFGGRRISTALLTFEFGDAKAAARCSSPTRRCSTKAPTGPRCAARVGEAARCACPVARLVTPATHAVLDALGDPRAGRWYRCWPGVRSPSRR